MTRGETYRGQGCRKIAFRGGGVSTPEFSSSSFSHLFLTVSGAVMQCDPYGEFPILVVSSLVVYNFHAHLRSFAPLLRSFVCHLLRSFTLFCSLLRVSVFRPRLGICDPHVMQGIQGKSSPPAKTLRKQFAHGGYSDLVVVGF